MHLSYKLYLTTVNSLKSLHKESMSTIESQRNVQALIRKRIDFGNVSVKAPKHKCILNTVYSESENGVTTIAW